VEKMNLSLCFLCGLCGSFKVVVVKAIQRHFVNGHLRKKFTTTEPTENTEERLILKSSDEI
jgi:hypothetical protein